jgi:voltage-gated potassium channel
VCIYILIGLLFGFAFLIVEYFFPGSMNGLESGPWQRNLDDLIYYSMITLTTVGYGDISPATPLTRFLAYMESGIGIFYTTILVASLIGMRLSAQQPQNPG